MNILKKIKKWFKKEDSLREKCIEAYGPEFGEIYDTLNSGGVVGGFLETAVIIQMIEDVKQGKIVKEK